MLTPSKPNEGIIPVAASFPCNSFFSLCALHPFISAAKRMLLKHFFYTFLLVCLLGSSISVAQVRVDFSLLVSFSKQPSHEPITYDTPYGVIAQDKVPDSFSAALSLLPIINASVLPKSVGPPRQALLQVRIKIEMIMFFKSELYTMLFEPIRFDPNTFLRLLFLPHFFRLDLNLIYSHMRSHLLFIPCTLLLFGISSMFSPGYPLSELGCIISCWIAFLLNFLH